MKIGVQKDLDYSRFLSDSKPLQVKYGLPPQVRYCSKCVISNQRPNSTNEFLNSIDAKKETIVFDSRGVCDACRVAAQKNNQIDWSERALRLQKLCDKFRRSDGRYDCIVPGSGGKDSFFAARVLKEEYGMHPLTVTWAPHLYTDWGWQNFKSWINSGQDNYLVSPNGRVHRLLTRLALELLLHPFQPFIFGQKTVAAKMAILHDVALVFYGENEAEYGNPLADINSSVRDADIFTVQEFGNVKLAGVEIKTLIDDFGIDRSELNPYLPLSKSHLDNKGVEVHYLGYYLKWHPQQCYYYAVEHGGFIASPERTPGTYSKYNSIDDKVDDLHYYTTRIKFGIGRASYDASQEIRSGDITREEGVALVRKFDHEFPERFIKELFEYLSIHKDEFPVAFKKFESPVMNLEYFQKLVDKFRSPHLWKFDEGKWSLRNPIQ